MSHSFPIQRLNLFVETFYRDEELVGLVVYFPFAGMIESKSQGMIQLEYVRSVVFTASENQDAETYVLEKSLPRFSNYYPVKYVVDVVHFDIRHSDTSAILSKFQFELYNLLPHIRHTLKTKKEKIYFCEMESIPSLQTSILSPEEPTLVKTPPIVENKIEESVNVLPPLAPPPPPKVKTLWDYHGYLGTPPKPSPWDAFASHLDSEENGGYCRGQWDGHLNEKAITKGVPYGIVDSNGNRDKIEDILSCKLLSTDDPLHILFRDLLNANNSHDRIRIVKNYLDERNIKYNDESFWIKEDGKPIIKQTFFKAVITPLVHKTPKFLYYLQTEPDA